MTPMPTPPYTHVVLCAMCKSQLHITAVRDDSCRSRTALTIACPVCKTTAEVVAPLAVVDSTVQIVCYEQPGKPAPVARLRKRA